MIEDITREVSESRINIPKDSIAYTRLIETQSVVKELKQEYPEILSLCVYGSNIKGFATQQSDIDGWMFVDSQLLARDIDIEESTLLEKKKETNRYTKCKKEEIYFCEEIEYFYDLLIQSEIKERLNLCEIQVQHLRTRPLRKKIIDYNLEYYKRWVNRETLYRKGEKNINRLRDYIGKPPIYSGCLNTGYLPYIFHMAIGQGVEHYRSYLVKELTKMGERGDIIWSEIIEGVEVMENRFMLKTNIKYPRTLSEAKEIYIT